MTATFNASPRRSASSPPFRSFRSRVQSLSPPSSATLATHGLHFQETPQTLTERGVFCHRSSVQSLADLRSAKSDSRRFGTMGRVYDDIGKEQASWIGKQPIFFVATAAPDAHVNVSPRGLDTFRVLGPNRVAW